VSVIDLENVEREHAATASSTFTLMVSQHSDLQLPWQEGVHCAMRSSFCRIPRPLADLVLEIRSTLRAAQRRYACVPVLATAALGRSGSLAQSPAR